MQLKRADFENVRQSRILLFVAIFLLFVPKINLISTGAYEGAGLRLDDILILITAPFFLFIIAKKGSISKLEVYFYIFFFYTLLVYFLNLPYSRGNILYPLRFFEYWMFFYFGRLFGGQEFFLKVMGAFVIYSGILIIAQDLHLIGGFRDGVYKRILNMPTGSTNGSYEISMVLALISPVFFLAKNKFTTYFFLIFSAFLIVLTESRTALAIQSLTFLFWIIFINKSSLIRKAVVLILLPISLIIFVITNLDLFERFFMLFTSDTYYALETILSAAPAQLPGDGSKEFLEQQALLKTGAVQSSLLESAGSSADLSLMVRFNKWNWGFSSFLAQGYFYIFVGIGGGVLGNALDGGLIRILIEYGIVGLCLFLLFMSKTVKNFRSIEFTLVIIFLLSNLFIDYYLSYKVTSVFFLILGYLFSRRKLLA